MLFRWLFNVISESLMNNSPGCKYYERHSHFSYAFAASVSSLPRMRSLDKQIQNVLNTQFA